MNELVRTIWTQHPHYLPGLAQTRRPGPWETLEAWSPHSEQKPRIAKEDQFIPHWLRRKLGILSAQMAFPFVSIP